VWAGIDGWNTEHARDLNEVRRGLGQHSNKISPRIGFSSQRRPEKTSDNYRIVGLLELLICSLDDALRYKERVRRRQNRHKLGGGHTIQ
jgi:hypothetical protein